MTRPASLVLLATYRNGGTMTSSPLPKGLHQRPQVIRRLSSSLNAKLILAFMMVGILPMAIVGAIAMNRAESDLTVAAGKQVELAAMDAAESIDRNLLERYDDVQSFASIGVEQNTSLDAGVLDYLTTTYGIYDLMLVVDLDGEVLAANTVSGTGASLDTASAVGRDVSNENWFQVVASNRTPSGGTFYSDAERNDIVGEIYGDERLTLPFTAPILGVNGETVGILHTDVSFERIVTDVMHTAREELVKVGAQTIETQVLRSDGVVLDDLDSSAVLSLNLSDAGAEAALAVAENREAEESSAGENKGHGFVVGTNVRTGVEQLNGYALSDGALGFDGYGWGILVQQDLSEATASVGSLQNLLLILGLLALVCVAGIGTWIARGVSAPVRQISRQAREIASGNITTEAVSVERTDEIGELATSFNEVVSVLNLVGGQAKSIADRNLSAGLLSEEVPGELGGAFRNMIDSLKTLVEQLQTSSEQLAGAAEELTAVSSSMGDSADRTSAEATSASATSDQVSSSVSTVAAAIEEMNASIREVAGNAVDASAVASDAVEVAKETSSTIGKLGESSEEIGNVIKVINSIAEQTNLLALNATIEAARAGEAGKGFAVVANEVKELANQTAKATEEISDRIRAIQDDTTGAVEANERIGETIDRINEISSTIASAVEEQSVTTAEIGRSVEEAAHGTSDIARSITDVATAAGATRQSTDETKTSAEELARMAADLNELVGQYR